MYRGVSASGLLSSAPILSTGSFNPRQINNTQHITTCDSLAKVQRCLRMPWLRNLMRDRNRDPALRSKANKSLSPDEEKYKCVRSDTHHCWLDHAFKTASDPRNQCPTCYNRDETHNSFSTSQRQLEIRFWSFRQSILLQAWIDKSCLWPAVLQIRHQIDPDGSHVWCSFGSVRFCKSVQHL